MFIPGSSNTNDFNINMIQEINLSNKLLNVSKYVTEVDKRTLSVIESFHKYIGAVNHSIPSEAFSVVFEK
jgi:hypothetical protein